MVANRCHFLFLFAYIKYFPYICTRKKIYTMKKLFSLLACAAIAVSLSAQTWNVSTLFHDGDVVDRDTTINGVTLKADASSSSHKMVVSSCTETLGNQTFSLRFKIDGGGNANYRHIQIAANPGDTIRVWVSSASSSLSERTMKWYKDQYNGDELGSFKASGITYGELVVEQPTATTVALAGSSSWYLYAVDIIPNPNYVYVAPTIHWYMKHPWGGGSWTWKELTPNADSTLYTIRDLYGANGCNYSQNADGSKSSWVEKPTVIGNPAEGDSCVFAFDPATKAITITIIGEEKPFVQRWYLNHPWGGGGTWSWKELTANEEQTIYSIRDIFGGNGFNYSTDKSGNAWIPESDLKKIGEPVSGDSALVQFFPEEKKIIVTKIVNAGTGLEDVMNQVQSAKFIRDGQFYIRRGERVYTVEGK